MAAPTRGGLMGELSFSQILSSSYSCCLLHCAALINWQEISSAAAARLCGLSTGTCHIGKLIYLLGTSFHIAPYSTANSIYSSGETLKAPHTNQGEHLSVPPSSARNAKASNLGRADPCMNPNKAYDEAPVTEKQCRICSPAGQKL